MGEGNLWAVQLIDVAAMKFVAVVIVCVANQMPASNMVA